MDIDKSGELNIADLQQYELQKHGSVSRNRSMEKTLSKPEVELIKSLKAAFKRNIRCFYIINEKKKDSTSRHGFCVKLERKKVEIRIRKQVLTKIEFHFQSGDIFLNGVKRKSPKGREKIYAFLNKVSKAVHAGKANVYEELKNG